MRGEHPSRSFGTLAVRLANTFFYRAYLFLPPRLDEVFPPLRWPTPLPPLLQRVPPSLGASPVGRARQSALSAIVGREGKQNGLLEKKLRAVVKDGPKNCNRERFEYTEATRVLAMH